MNIEDELSPTTVNEVLLLNRIRELHRNRLMNVHSFDFSKPSLDHDLTLASKTETLFLAAEATVEEDWKGFSLTTRSTGFVDDKLNISYREFADRSVFNEGWDKYHISTLLGHLHKNLIHKLAEHLNK